VGHGEKEPRRDNLKPMQKEIEEDNKKEEEEEEEEEEKEVEAEEQEGEGRGIERNQLLVAEEQEIRNHDQN
jgi:hypothetical protein